MLHSIIFAEIRKDATNHEYLYIQCIADSPFATQVHGVVLHVDDRKIPILKDMISSGAPFPKVRGKNVIVDNLPEFKWINQDGVLSTNTYTSIRLFILEDEDDNPIEHAETSARRILRNKCVLV